MVAESTGPLVLRRQSQVDYKFVISNEASASGITHSILAGRSSGLPSGPGRDDHADIECPRSARSRATLQLRTSSRARPERQKLRFLVGSACAYRRRAHARPGRTPLSTVEASILRAEWQILLRARRSRFWGRATQVTRAPIAMRAAPNDPSAARAAPVAAKGGCDCWDWPIGGGQGTVISSVSTVWAVSPTAKLTTSRSAHASSS
jgi:hypothetical protein